MIRERDPVGVMVIERGGIKYSNATAADDDDDDGGDDSE
jgi:hypothetical protein